MGDHAKRFSVEFGVFVTRGGQGPVRVGRDGSYLLCIDSDDRLSLLHVLAELRDSLLADAQTATTDNDKFRRLFPAAYHEDPELDAEYQRLMKGELLASRLESLATTCTALTQTPNDDTVVLTPQELDVLMRSINDLRLVLGTMLDVQEGDNEYPNDELADDDPAQLQLHLYAYLGWLLDWAVRAQLSALPTE